MPGKLPRILLLEDDAVQAMTVVAALDDILGRVTTVREVGEAIALMRRSPFDLCLVDLGVYDANGEYQDLAGLDFIAEARGAISHSAPMIVMTAWRDPTVLVPCFQSGADDYVLKSEGIDRTVARVKRWISKLPLEPMDLFSARQKIIDLLDGTGLDASEDQPYMAASP